LIDINFNKSKIKIVNIVGGGRVMFKSLRVKNFRSIRDSGEIKLSNLNVFVGPNNSGKSSILYSIMLIKMTLEDKDENLSLVTCTPELDLGSYLDLIRGHKAERKLTLEFMLDKVEAMPPFSLGIEDLKLEGLHTEGYGKCKVEFYFDKSKNLIEVISFDGRNLSDQNILSMKKVDGTQPRIKGPQSKLLPHMSIAFVHFIPFVIPSGPKPKNSKVSNSVIEWTLSSRFNAQMLARKLAEVRYVAPIRERIPRYGMVGTVAYSELGPSGQNLMRVLSSDMVDEKKETAIQKLNYWLNTKFKLLKNVRILDIDEAGTVKALVADDRQGERNINLASMGCGISQLVPVVVQTVLMPSSGCLLVEQPEIHLHPSAQADLADLFIKNIGRKRQFIIETHSEHFVLRLRRRIAEGKIKPEKIGIFFVEKKKGITWIQKLNLKSNGHFEEWPTGFFEEGFKEALAIAEAGSVSST
jgi:predicted ATPase